MKAIYLDKPVDSIDELLVREAPEPTLKANQVLVEVRAVGTNFFEILMSQGKHQIKPPLPFTPGSEFAGVVLRVDPGVTHLQPGDRVFGAVTYGCYAERVAVDAKRCLPIPRGMSYEEACGLYITLPTGYAALKLRANLQPGEICLVHAAAGGVGLTAVQLAKAMGATVIATVGSEEKMRIAREHGADYVLNYRDPEWPKQVRALTPNGRGVDVVYDPVGMLNASLGCVAWSARVLVIGFAGGKIEQVAANRILLKNISIIGLFWALYEMYESDTFFDIWDELLVMLNEDKVHPVVYQEQFVGLESISDALKTITSRRSYGKVVVSLPTGRSHL
ncbi:zinc-binding dehydrogenase [Syncephalis pseudoplumigaleata]|uniref:Zinc-binding dehydrogenase n=1 Tax=Syncephalis pseudoplumigaleata TaxID=1712513 RepID=A0A4P9YU37_9FUNG|nr:zinc-binding dehydrogenase [Syncephalis pseudoplumigaleata]|eukprot:RKP23523.1 zinc-binding dehydrogenase [Syncephalis pseudoplumigaleata]